MLDTYEIAPFVEHIGNGFFSRDVLPDFAEACHTVEQSLHDADSPTVMSEWFLRKIFIRLEHV